MNESREWRRIEVDIAAQGETLAAPGSTFSSRVVNINPDGLCFLAPQGLAPGQDVRLSLELPVIGQMEVRLRIVWTGYLEQFKSYRAGGKFVVLPEGEKDKFLRFYHLKVMSLPEG